MKQTRFPVAAKLKTWWKFRSLPAMRLWLQEKFVLLAHDQPALRVVTAILTGVVSGVIKRKADERTQVVAELRRWAEDNRKIRNARNADVVIDPDILEAIAKELDGSADD